MKVCNHANRANGCSNSADVGCCWRFCANGRNNSLGWKDVQCIMGRIRPIRLCKLTKFGCHLVFNTLMCCYLHGDHNVVRVCGPNNVGRAVQTNPTLLRYASAITEQKQCWELLAQKFDQFQTLCSNSQKYSTTCNRVCERTQHVTTNNVASVCTLISEIFHWLSETK